MRRLKFLKRRLVLVLAVITCSLLWISSTFWSKTTTTQIEGDQLLLLLEQGGRDTRGVRIALSTGRYGEGVSLTNPPPIRDDTGTEEVDTTDSRVTKKKKNDEEDEIIQHLNLTSDDTEVRFTGGDGGEIYENNVGAGFQSPTGNINPPPSPRAVGVVFPAKNISDKYYYNPLVRPEESPQPAVDGTENGGKTRARNDSNLPAEESLLHNETELGGGFGQSLKRLQLSGGYIGCSAIEELGRYTDRGNGFTKFTEIHSVRDGRRIAVKSVLPDSRDFKVCMSKTTKIKQHECYLMSNFKLLKEAILLQELDNPAIPKLLGLCVRSEEVSPLRGEKGVQIVVEAGLKGVIYQIRRMNWTDRLDICIQLVELVTYLSDSPVGKMCISDFKLDQFVIARNGTKPKIMLIDLDDMNTIETDCSEDDDCAIDTRISGLPCVSGRCHGLIPWRNLASVTRLFISNIGHMLDTPDYFTLAADEIKVGVLGFQMDARQVLQTLAGVRDHRQQT